VLRAGVQLVEAGRADFLYLSTTDFMQHKFAPEDSEALDFYAGIDEAKSAGSSTSNALSSASPPITA
jgi:predicted AlkP superfamily pyrophosphatase or phosphodiesterase